jgi:hypothetical protein
MPSDAMQCDNIQSVLCSVAMHCCYALLLCTVVMHCGYVVLLCTVVMHCCYALWLCSVIMHCCYALLLCSVIMHCCYALWLCNVIMHCCYALLLCIVVMYCCYALLSCRVVMLNVVDAEHFLNSKLIFLRIIIMLKYQLISFVMSVDIELSVTLFCVTIQSVMAPSYRQRFRISDCKVGNFMSLQNFSKNCCNKTWISFCC